MLIQFGCGLLSGISITVLKDADGAFAYVIHLDEVIVAAFLPPAEAFSAEFILIDIHGTTLFSSFIWWEAIRV
jgi:hypothetical protein